MVLSVNGRSLKAAAIIALSLSCCMSVRVAAFSFATPSALRPAFAQAPQLRRGERASGITALRASDKNAEVCIFLFEESSPLKIELKCCTDQIRRQMAAALASVLLASGLPAVAQEPAMTPPAPQQEMVAAPVSSGGIQNWRYSEFISAVEKDKVEKVQIRRFAQFFTKYI
jgi:hypothetical protein